MPPIIPVLRLPNLTPDPRVSLRGEALGHGVAAPPLLPMAGTATERWHLLLPDPPPDLLGALEARLLSDPGVLWVGGWGRKVLVRGGSPMVATVARVRTRESAWCAVWPRAAGEAPDPELVHEWDDSRPMPAWLAPLFPPLVAQELLLVDAGAAEVPRPPDEIVPVAAGVTQEDVARIAGTRLEARLVTTGKLEVAAVGWFPGEIRLWWGMANDEALARLGVRVAADATALAVGAYGAGDDKQQKCKLIGLLLESRGGRSLLWAHRYDEVGDGEARWRGPAEIRPGPALGWFAAAGG